MNNRSITITFDEDDREVVRIRLHPRRVPDILIHKDYVKEKTTEECAGLMKDVDRWINLLIDQGVIWINYTYR